MNNFLEEKIKEQFGEIVFRFPILHHNWEGDGYGYIVDNEGKKMLVLTDHNKPYVAELSELHAKIAEYQIFISETENAIFILNEQLD